MKKSNNLSVFLRKNWVIILIILIVSMIFAYSYYSKGLIYSMSISDSDSIIEYIGKFGIFSNIVFTFLVILESVIAPIPAVALYVAGGAFFGAFFGGVLALIGNLIGAAIAFLLARRLGREYVEKKVDKKMMKTYDKFSQKYGIFSLFVLRVNPLTSSDLFSYIAGLTKMRLREFLIGTGLGLTPIVFLHTFFGEFFLKEHPVLYSILVWISLIYLLVFVYLVIVAARKKKN